MKQFFLFFSIIFFNHFVFAQNLAIGQWQDHLSYKSGISVAASNSQVYCATTSGFFVLNKADNSMEHLSKINGLSDVKAVVVNYNNYNNKFLIAYQNSNIDIIDNGAIINIADILNSEVTGNKSINNIYFINQYAYLACSFGIVLINMDKYETEATYYIANNGAAINVRDITSDSTYLYAATDGGVYRALLSSPDLQDYHYWSLLNGVPKGIYNTITTFGNKIYANFSSFLKNGSTNKDTTYVYNDTMWNYFGNNHSAMNSLNTYNNQLVAVYDTAISIFNTNLSLIHNYTGYFGASAEPKQAVIDNVNNLWIADSQFGLVSLKNGGGFQYNYPNGPASANVSAMSIQGNNLWVAPGTGYGDGLYTYNGQNWVNISGNYPSIINFDTIHDVRSVLVDSINTNNVYATCRSGLIQFNNGTPVQLYNGSNTNNSLTGLNVPSADTMETNGLTIDASDNLWIANAGNSSSLSVKGSNGFWQSLNFSSVIGNTSFGQMVIDQYNQEWVVVMGGGIMVYNGTTTAPNASNTKLLTTTVGNGNLPSLNIYCLAIDFSGNIWVGTDQGITVFYSPGNVFTGQNFDSQQIYVQQNGITELLLQTELIQAIAIDGANRKWIATKGSGVYLMSSDGTEQIYHFSASTSPLFSNNVKSIAINGLTGEVYFGTSNGIIAYKGIATTGQDEFSNVYSYPNPVKHSYEGPIAIKGLVGNSVVKITDINGTLVFQTVSQGGQAIWSGNAFNGERVKTGVYMVFCTSQDGTQKVATKILFIN